jgi:hypothetical protein
LTIWVGGNGNGATGEGEGGWGYGCGGPRGAGTETGFDGGGGGGGSAVALGRFPVSGCSDFPNSPEWLIAAGGGGGGGGAGATPFAGQAANPLGGQGGAGGGGLGLDVNTGALNGDTNLVKNGVLRGGGGCGARSSGPCTPYSPTQTGVRGGTLLRGGGGGGGGGQVGGGGGQGGSEQFTTNGSMFGGGGGGGGGLSTVFGSQVSNPGLIYGGSDPTNVNGESAKDGSVVLTTNPVAWFSTNNPTNTNFFNFDAPAGATRMHVHAEGAGGGYRIDNPSVDGGGPFNSAYGSPGGIAEATFPVEAGVTYTVILGRFGDVHGGQSSDGDGGEDGEGDPATRQAYDGGGGGGGTGLQIVNKDYDVSQLLVAGGGGGGGGDGSDFLGSGGLGGTGCSGDGQSGISGADGGQGGGNTNGPAGTDGHNSIQFEGGGGGGGGGGLFGGLGGDGGGGDPVNSGGVGGGGGGGGACGTGVTNASDLSGGISGVAGDGYMIITFDTGANPTRQVVTPARVRGEAEGIGKGTSAGMVQISGSFVLPQGVSLGQLIDWATVVSLTDLLDEVGGRGELSRNPTTASHLPTLTAAPGSTPNGATTYETTVSWAPKVELNLRGKAYGRNGGSDRIDFDISVDGSLIRGCAAGTNSTQLTGGFELHSETQLLRVEWDRPWTCHGSEMEMH